MNKNEIFKTKSEGVYSFFLSGKEFELSFDGISPRVFYQNKKQKAKTILRDLIETEKLPIYLFGVSKKGDSKEYTTDEIGSQIFKFIGIEKVVKSKPKSALNNNLTNKI